jgi:hypothetical protein
VHAPTADEPQSGGNNDDPENWVDNQPQDGSNDDDNNGDE